MTKRANIHQIAVPTLVDAIQGGPQLQNQQSSMFLSPNTPGIGSNNLDYNNYGNYTRDLKELKKRDTKLEEKINAQNLAAA